MKKIWNSLVMAFSTYFIVPKTQMERNKETTSYILVFIPLIGAVIGLVISGWATVYPYLCGEKILPAVVCAVLPSILSRGAHLDGFFRTVDAMCSHQPRERKLKILEDSHGGYFAIIVCICYFMMTFGMWSEMPIDGLYILAYGYVISRALYGFSILTSKHAKVSKCSVYLPEGALKYVQIIIMLLYVAVSAFLMLQSERRDVAFACLIGVVVSYIYYQFVSYKEFGGVTEDSAGFFVQICEILIPLAALIAYRRWW